MNGNTVEAAAGAELAVATLYSGRGDSASGNVIDFHVPDAEGESRITVDHVYDMIGGLAAEGDAKENRVHLVHTDAVMYGRPIPEEGYTPTSYLTGAYAAGRAEGNALWIQDSWIQVDPENKEPGTDNLLISGGTGGTGASHNEASILDSTVNGNYMHGGSTSSGEAAANWLHIEGSNVTLTEAGEGLIGGRTGSGDASENTVEIVNSTAAADTLIGGRTGSGNATENTVWLGDGATANVEGYIIGGYSEEGHATGNEIWLRNNAKAEVQENMYGGYSGNGSAAENYVWGVDSTWIARDMYGGYGTNGDAAENWVWFMGASTVTARNLYGGYAAVSGDASGNEVWMAVEEAAITGSLYGGYAVKGDASKNQVWLLEEDTKVSGIVGGYTKSGSASANSVEIEGGTVTGAGEIYGGEAFDGTAVDNHVFISKGRVTTNLNNFMNEIAGGYVEGGNAQGNVLTIEDSTFISESAGAEWLDLYGGYSPRGDRYDRSGSTADNVVVIASSVFNEYSDVHVWGGSATDGHASRNTVIIEGETNSQWGQPQALISPYGFMEAIPILVRRRRTGSSLPAARWMM